MGPACPRCKNSDFSLGALILLHPYPGELRPASIICPSCGMLSRVTAKSRLLAAASMVVLFGSIFAVVETQIHLQNLQVVGLALLVTVAYFLAIWPFVVRLKPWSEFQYWQPKNRLVGYAVYLLPAAVVALLFYLAVRFKVGM